MAKNKWLDYLMPKSYRMKQHDSWLKSLITSGSLYKISDIRENNSFSTIKSTIDTMRALAQDSQIDTALSYYATDATVSNTSGQIIWATPTDEKNTKVAEVINALFDRWEINKYVRSHILELATIGNLYIPTTYLYDDEGETKAKIGVALDNNTLNDEEFDIIPSYKIDPQTIIHLWYRGKPQGYILEPEESSYDYILLPESACIHFALDGLIGDYKFNVKTKSGEDKQYDIQFSNPLMSRALLPTQTLKLLEDANLLASLARTIKFINVRAGGDEEEIEQALIAIKDTIQQQMSLDTNSGDAQSYVNPQSPNNLVYVPFVDGQEAISITDLNMAESNDADNKLLEYYRDKKLSVLGVPKEAMNFSSNEGLGGAGSVLSQRSALYANSLRRIEQAYLAGWKDALNKYFIARNMSGMVNQFTLHMNPIITTQSTLQFERRDSTLTQAQSFIDICKSINVEDKESVKRGLTEILTEVFPTIGSDVMNWHVDVKEEDGGDDF